MNASDIPCRVLLSQWQVKQVLGDRGEENLKRLRMASGANVQLLRGPLLPAAFRARDEFLAVFWADDGVRLRRALNGLLERAYAKRQVGGLQPKEDQEPESHVLEVMIPEVACRHLIGARGDRIKLLREESRCEIHMSPGNVAGIAEQRRVKCNGLIPSIAEAVARIHEVLVEFAEIGILSLRHFDLQEVSTGAPQESNEGPKERLLGHGLAGIGRREARNARIAVRQLVSGEECGWLIGKRGNKIHKLRELALVSTREADAEVCNGCPRSVVEIFGAPLTKCICVLQLIVDDLELFPEVQPCTSLLVPSSLSPFLSRGLDEASVGCDARVLTGKNWLLLELRGSAQQRLLGAQAAHEAVEAAAALRDDATDSSPKGGAESQRAFVSRAMQSTQAAQDPAEGPRSAQSAGFTEAIAAPPAMLASPEVMASEASFNKFPPQGSAALQKGEACPVDAWRSNSTLLLSFKSYPMALRLASQHRIAQRAGVTLEVEQEAWPGVPDGAVMRILGQPMANAVACFLLQRAQWLERTFGPTV